MAGEQFQSLVSLLKDHIQRTAAQGVHGIDISALAASVFWSGFIAMSDVACPSGWTRLSAMDNRFPRGSATAGTTGGADTHYHTVVLPASWDCASGGWDAANGTTVNSSEVSHVPSYRTVIFCKKD